MSLEKVTNEGLAEQAPKQAAPAVRQSVDLGGKEEVERRQEGSSLRLG